MSLVPFLLGKVWSLLEENHYPAFLVSDACYKMLEDAHEHAITIAEDNENSSHYQILEDHTVRSFSR